MSAPSPHDIRRQASRLIVYALAIQKDYAELHDEAHGMTGRDKAHIQRGEHADPTGEIFLAKGALRGRCRRLARRMNAIERQLRDLANEAAHALTTETAGGDDDLEEGGLIVSAEERERIHLEREREMRSA